MSTISTNNYRAAIFQAGHAVASNYFGVKFQQVSIDGTGVKQWKIRDAALWEQLKGKSAGKPWTEATIERKTLITICILFAGEVALERAGIATPGDGSAPREIQELAAVVKDEMEVDFYMKDCRAYVAEILDWYWSQVEQVAGELQTVSKLTGKQVSRLVENLLKQYQQPTQEKQIKGPS